MNPKPEKIADKDLSQLTSSLVQTTAKLVGRSNFFKYNFGRGKRAKDAGGNFIPRSIQTKSSQKCLAYDVAASEYVARSCSIPYKALCSKKAIKTSEATTAPPEEKRQPSGALLRCGRCAGPSLRGV